MAVREYVGARYVPIFDGDWDNTKTYEPLTIVSVTNVGSYTSKKFVPVGVDISDTEYWALTGNTTGQIINLQNQIDAINDVLDMMRYKKIVFLADSYGNRTGLDGKTVADGLRDEGWNIVFDIAIGGGGFTKTGNLNIQSHLDDYTGDHDEITDVIFACSANDNGSVMTDIRDAVANGVNLARTKYPNAKVHVIPWGVIMLNTDYAANLMTVTQQGYNWGVMASKGVIAKNAQYMLRNSAYLEADSTHPSAYGVSIITRFISAYLAGKEIDVLYETDVNLSAADDPSILSLAATGLHMRRHNGIVELAHKGNDNMMLFTFNGTSSPFDATANGLTLDTSLISIPWSYLTDKWYSIWGNCGYVSGSGYPTGVDSCAGVMRFTIFRDRIKFILNPTMAYQYWRFWAFDAHVTLTD